MTSESEVIAQLDALTQRARAATDTAAAGEVLAQVSAVAQQDFAAPSRALAAALINAASALVEHGAPSAVEQLFGRSQQLLNTATDAQVDDFLMLWHNLSVLCDKHGAHELRNQALALILKVAETYEGPLQPHGAHVFAEQAMTYGRFGKMEPMRTLLRQACRFHTAADRPSEERLAWIESHVGVLRDAGRNDEALTVIAQGIALAQQCGAVEREAWLLIQQAAVNSERGDDASALVASERACTLAAQPALAATEVAAMVWLNFAALLLRQRAADRYAEGLDLCNRAIDLLRKLGRTEVDYFADALYHRAVLQELLGHWSDAARDYLAAAAVPGAASADVTTWLSLAGRTLFEAGQFDAASDCYLDAVRRRVVAAVAAVAQGEDR